MPKFSQHDMHFDLVLCQQRLGYNTFDEYKICSEKYPDTTPYANSEVGWGSIESLDYMDFLN